MEEYALYNRDQPTHLTHEQFIGRTHPTVYMLYIYPCTAWQFIKPTWLIIPRMGK